MVEKVKDTTLKSDLIYKEHLIDIRVFFCKNGFNFKRLALSLIKIISHETKHSGI